MSLNIAETHRVSGHLTIKQQMLPSVQVRKELEACKKLCTLAKTCSGEKIGIGNGGARDKFCVTETAEDLQVS